MTEPKRIARRDPETFPEIEPLLELARSQLTEAEPRRGASGLALVEQRLAGHAKRRPRSAIRRGGSAALVAAGCAGWLAWTLTHAPLEMDVVAGELAAKDQLSSASTTTTVRFSDGTQLSVEPAARAEVAKVSARGADIRLRHGQLRLQVAKRPNADWNVLAGAYRVHVTGTSLAVALAENGERLVVQLFSGSVRVSGPLIDGDIEVTREQRLSIESQRGRVRIEPLAAPSEDARPTAAAAPALPEVTPPEAAPPEAAPPEAARAPAASDAPPRAGRARKHSKAAASWSRQVAAGKFDDVLNAAQARGLDTVYQRASLDDLAALADAARYARRGPIAREALLAMRARFAGSKPAKQAAFLLGRLMEDDSGASALSWYERYLQEEPRGVHASQALGRKMLILHRQGGAVAAMPAAREYLKRFPQGSHAPSAAKIIADH